MTVPYQLCEATVGTHPAACQLLPRFDTAALLTDLGRLDRHQWALQQTFETDGPAERAEFDWRALPLRSPTGSPARTDPGGPGLDAFADTPWRAEAPYLSAILDLVPAPLRAVRLLALGPGAASTVHFDTKMGFPWGCLRLHVPLVTNPGAVLTVDGEAHVWQPGTFWFGDFCRMHQVVNTGARKRVHMVVDTTLTAAVLDLFPESFREALDPEAVLVNRPERPLTDPARYHCAFDLPLSFSDFEEVEGQFLLPQPTLPARVDTVDGRLVLFLSGEPRFGLVHLGDGEFRFTGWTDERTVQIRVDGGQPAVLLRTRHGRREQRLDVPAAVPGRQRA